MGSDLVEPGNKLPLKEVREITDPFTGEQVQIRDDLTRRLRGEYAVGPTLPNGEPEFGWRKFGEPSSIHLEAATEIERVRRALSELLEQIECLGGIEYCRDVEPYKAEACWDYAVRRAQDALSKATSSSRPNAGSSKSQGDKK